MTWTTALNRDSAVHCKHLLGCSTVSCRVLQSVAMLACKLAVQWCWIFAATNAASSMGQTTATVHMAAADQLLMITRT